ncbi:MAG TPA: 3-deoxy-D-manno-octulosonate 8-phosphate phosphatase [Candidatus Marinimicrobia bacterium]|jgi:3-deoxy-D-manno-octulosonate 8-phosphate phosphatase (KDO 8-P phosphatase)|nr:3-deoxy-D-manno-octulosonate 8-phosphate phosphatase [Candidatus Neomarinimicrobiota bacterium]
MVDIYSSPNFETEFETEVIERGNKVKLVIADVDGVLTDGSVYKAKDPETLADIEFKQFSIVDGAGIALARLLDLRVAIISGRPSLATDARVKELKIEDVYTGLLNKMIPYKDLKSKYSLNDEDIAFIGDDIIDLNLMENVGAPIAVANAYHLVKDIAIYTTRLPGGQGAFREAIDWLAMCQGRYEEGIQLMKDSLLTK